MKYFSIFIAIFTFSIVSAQVVRFDDFRLISVKLTPLLMKEFASEIILSHDGSMIENAETQVLLRPSKLHLLQNISHVVLESNYQNVIDLETKQISDAKNSNWFGNYHKYEEHLAYVLKFKTDYPSMVEVETIGKSVEGRDLHVVLIHAPGTFNPQKKAMIIHTGMHAREWATHATGQWFALQMLSKYASEPRIKSLLDNVNIFYCPFVNPDGFKFTERNRMWRKNRRGGYGVDLNRNWRSGWGGEGSSNQRSSEVYRGESPVSEPESQALDKFYAKYPSLRAGIDLHQYGQIILRPFGKTIQPPPEEAKFKAIGEKMVSAIRSVNGLTYRSVRAREFWAAAGIMSDHLYEIRKMIGFTIEMRPPHASFHIPPEQILPNAKENFEALMVMAEEVKNL